MVSSGTWMLFSISSDQPAIHTGLSVISLAELSGDGSECNANK